MESLAHGRELSRMCKVSTFFSTHDPWAFPGHEVFSGTLGFILILLGTALP